MSSIQNLLDDTGEESFLMINSAAAPFDDIRVRQALTHATPVENYNLLIGLGINRPANQPFTPESPYYNPDVEQLSDRPDLAGPLVAEYCAEVPDNCSDGKINMEYMYAGPSVVGTRIADLLAEGWGEFFNVSPNEVPQDSLIQNAAFGLYQTVGWRQFGAVDPSRDNVWLLCRTVGPVSLNWPRLCDESRDELLLEGTRTTDPAERIPIYQELAQKLSDDYLYIFYQHTIWDTALAENVRNLCGRTSPEGVELRCSINGRTFFSTVFIEE